MLKKTLNDLNQENSLDFNPFDFEQYGEAVVTLEGPDWYFSNANEAALRLYGVASKDKFCALLPWELSPLKQSDGQLSQEKAKWVISQAIENNSYSFEWNHKKLDGTEFPCSVFLSRISYQGKIYVQAIIRDISKEKKLEQQFLEVSGIAQIGSWHFDLITFEQTWTLEHYQIFEIDYPQSQDMLYKLYRERIHPDDLVVLDRLIERATHFGEDFVFDHRVILDNGERIKYVQGIGKVTKDKSGRPIAIMGTCRDITKNVDQEKKYSAILEGMHEGLIVYEADGKVVQFNSAALKISGLNSEQMNNHNMNDSVWDFIKENGMPFQRDERPGQYVLKTGMPMTNVTMGLKRREEVRWWNVNAIPLKKSTGTKVLVTFTDITEIIRANEERRFVLDGLQVGIFKVDLKTEEQTWDKSMYELYEFPFGENVPLEEWYSTLTDESKKIIENQKLQIRNGATGFNSTFEINCKNGNHKYIGCKSKVVLNDQGGPEALLGLNWDRTKEVRIEQELHDEKSKAMHNAKLVSIGQLAAGVGHEINNPLAIISGQVSILTEMLQEDGVSREKVLEGLKKMEVASSRIAHILTGLRSFTRSDEQENIKFSVFDLVAETFHLLKEIYEREEIYLTFSGVDKKRIVFGNRGRLQQALFNIISNAKDAVSGRDTKIIELVLENGPNESNIIVIDNGIGVPDKYKDKIFDAFFTTKEVHKGTGIGLPIVNNIIKEYHGKLSFNSKENEGTKFIITLPTTVEEESSIQDEVIMKVENPQKLNCRILVVDDEEDLREVLVNILSKFCREVIEVKDVKEALDFVQKEKVDLVISDIKMPKVDGFEFLKRLRLIPEIKQPKFIFVSGGVEMDEVHQKIIEKEADGLFGKPFKVELIKEKLKELFKL